MELFAKLFDSLREKTKVVDLKQEKAEVNFLGYKFRLIRDLFGRAKQFLNMAPSEKAMKKEREKLHELTSSQSASNRCRNSLPKSTSSCKAGRTTSRSDILNRISKAASWEIDWCVRERLIDHLQRRSQRGYEFPKDRTIFQWFEEQGLIALSGCEATRHRVNA